ncbi:MAG TPA: radical SAM family heme chaperone HemW [Tepidisphaeraceae bacterium]|nr:radical SAM family heme chaperone HemW [Tepidisphaeraceae bacterium]
MLTALELLQPSVSLLCPSFLPKVEVEGLYVHVPFCFHKCHYCDFYSITRQTPERMARYVDLLLREAEQWTHQADGPTARLQTIFFGGGTPTLLPVVEMRRLILGLRERFDFSLVTEFTVEADPATLSDEFAAMLRDVGVDRLSFGAQSFDRAELATLERHHDPEDVPRSLDIARAAGFARLNLDLIYAIPGQTIEKWSHSLERAIALNTPHLSCYGLTYEPNTPIAVKKRLGTMIPTEESLELDMMHFTRRRLVEINRPAYEISNYAVPGEQCRHNLVYWTGGNYIGLGPSAASHVSGWRWKNRPHLREWESAIQADHLPASDVEQLTPDQRAGELAMLLLRLADGLNFATFADRTGRDAQECFARQIDQLAPTGLITLDDRAIRLTDRALGVADAVAAEFLA